MTSPHSHSRRTGFTLVEVLVAIVIIGVLVALLLQVIAGAVKTARNAQVSGEQQILSQALASFKNQYGDYPPSRILLSENGLFNTGSSTALAVTNGADITGGQLAARSIQYLRKFWPRVNFSTTSAVFASGSTAWYDFDGDGVFNTTPYVLDGRQCLTFFLGGIPQTLSSGNVTTIAMTGFSKNPNNPFAGQNVAFGSTNRTAPMMEFDTGRLAVPPNLATGLSTNMPAYRDSLGSTDQNGQPSGYYAYFSAYGNNAYDPNDVNVNEQDSSGTTSPVMEFFNVAFPVFDTSGSSSQGPGSATANYAKSPDPNPYSSSFGQSSTGAVNWINPNSFQIISPGADGVYGPGGQYLSSGGSELLPLDPSATTPYNTTDPGIRIFERDNITSFHNGKLE